MKHKYVYLIALLVAAPAISCAQTAELDPLLAQVAKYEYGQSREPLQRLSEPVRKTIASPSAVPALKAALDRFLESQATRDGKEAVCRELSVMGSERCVPALARLLDQPLTAVQAAVQSARNSDQSATAPRQQQVSEEPLTAEQAAVTRGRNLGQSATAPQQQPSERSVRVRATRGTRGTRGAGIAAAMARGLFAIALAHSGWQAWQASTTCASDPRNQWAYAQTGAGVSKIIGRLHELSLAAQQGRNVSIDIYSRENLWPLPWYLRSYPNVRWWRSVPLTAGAAPIVLLSPALEIDVARRIYEAPLPGERELYVSMFPGYVELRPAVEVRGYVAKTLWDRLPRP
jgi:hypothetical protein